MLSRSEQNRAWQGLALVCTIVLAGCSFDGGVASTLSDAGVVYDARIDAPEPLCPRVNEELRLCMLFEHETGEITLVDDSQHGNDAVVANSDFMLRQDNQALVTGVDFDSLIADDVSMDPVLNLTIEMLLRPDARITNRQWLFDNNNQWALYVDNENRIGCDIGQGRDVSSSNMVIVPGTFQHVACVYDGDFLKLFVEGRRVAARVATGDLLQADVEGSCIAQDCPGGGGEYIGQMDNLRIWGIARTRLKICEAAGISASGCPEEPPDPMP